MPRNRSRKHSILSRFRERAVHENLFALQIALTLEKDLHQAKMLALTIVDWAHCESNKCQDKRIEQRSRQAMSGK